MAVARVLVCDDVMRAAPSQLNTHVEARVSDKPRHFPYRWRNNRMQPLSSRLVQISNVMQYRNVLFILFPTLAQRH